MSALDAARAELQRHGHGPAFIAALEAFEAAVRANERGEAPAPTPSPTAVYLATRCNACQHTLNWHRNDVGCTVVLCVCGRFQPPEEEQP